MLPSRGPAARILGAVVRAEARPSERPAPQPDALRIHVIDGLSVEGFAEHQLGSRKARVALRMLGVAQGRPVSVERLADALAEGELEDMGLSTAPTQAKLVDLIQEFRNAPAAPSSRRVKVGAAD